MYASPRISYRHFAGTATLEARVHEHICHVERFYGEVTECNVMIDAAPQSECDRMAFNARVELVSLGMRVEGDSHCAAGEAHADPYIALRDAFDSARRRLRELALLQSAKTSSHRPAARHDPAVP